MTSQFTGTHPRKKDRLKSRKFSEDEPYDRATDAMLANSSLSGGRKLSLQQGTLIQAQPNALKQDYVMTFNQQPPISSSMNTAPTVIPGYTIAPQSLNQQGFILSTGVNYPVNYAAQGLSQPGITTHFSGIPMNYGTEGYVQQGLVNNIGSNMPVSYANEGSLQQGLMINPGGNVPTNYATEVVSQQGFVGNAESNVPLNYSTETLPQQGLVGVADGRIPINYSTEGLTQQGYTTTEGLTQANYVVNNNSEGLTEEPFTSEPANEGIHQAPYFSDTHAHQHISNPNTELQENNLSSVPTADSIPQSFAQDFNQLSLGQPGLVQPGLVAGTEVTSNQVMEPTYITGTQSYAQPGLLTDAVIGTGLTAGVSTLPQSLNQPGLNTTIPQDISQSGLNTGFIEDSTKPPVADTKIAHILPAEIKKIDPNAGGIFTFKPLEGKFPKDKDIVGKMDPYCKIKIGMHSGKTSVAKNQGAHPVWNDVITLQKKHNEQFALLKIRDHETLKFDHTIGETKIPLGEIATRGKINQWYPIYNKDQLTGEVLMEITFQPKIAASK